MTPRREAATGAERDERCRPGTGAWFGYVRTARRKSSHATEDQEFIDAVLDLGGA
jgi:hypothetical protein